MSAPAPFICRLFDRQRPFEQVEARLIAEGSVSVGRDPAADWPIYDADGTLSRVHCRLEAREGRLLLHDQSTNGTFLDSGERAPRDAAVEVGVGQSLRLGGFCILIEQADEQRLADPAATALLDAPPPPLPSDWLDPAPARAPCRDASLLEAFCDGAKLDASAFSSEDPHELMRRLGAVYQQTVLGLAALMTERAKMKGEHQLDRTTISAQDNNPFKWAPSRKLAEDLLRPGKAGFLSDAEAVRACFGDLSRHLGAVAAGAATVADRVVETLSPAVIDAEARAQSSLLKSRQAACWEIFARRHAELTQSRAEAAPLTKAFAEGYTQAMDAAAR